MEIMSVGEFKTHFSEALKKVQAGQEIGISYGKNKEVVARLVPKIPATKEKRKLGIWEKKGTVTFHPGFSMTEKELLRL
jgi:antitoxin (DNA-binding transcriptional repressor) of toxin-antitoxin stability system